MTQSIDLVHKALSTWLSCDVKGFTSISLMINVKNKSIDEIIKNIKKETVLGTMTFTMISQDILRVDVSI